MAIKLGKEFLIFLISTFVLFTNLLGSGSFLGSDPLVFLNNADAQLLPDPPEILQRFDWRADENILSWEAEYPDSTGSDPVESGYKVKKIVLHDTGSKILQQDPDGSGFYKEKVKNIYRYHVLNAPYEDGTDRRGFGDMGYHYLIDPNGNIYKGRVGKNGVIGAQVFGFNEGYIGISLLGTYGSNVDGEYIEHEFTSKMRESLEKLVGWLAAANGIDISSVSEVCGFDKNKNTICKNVHGLTTHKAVAPTQDPGKIVDEKLPDIRMSATRYQAEYRSYLYKESSSPTVYQFKDGVRYEYNSIEEFTSSGGRFLRVAIVSKDIIDMFAPPGIYGVSLSDGDLTRDSIGKFYLLEKNVLRPFNASFGRIGELGFGIDNATILSAQVINKYSKGNPIEYGPDGELVRGDGSQVYLIEGGKKRWITSAALFNALGYDWARIQQYGNINNYLSGRDVSFNDGSLLREDAKPEVYVLKNGRKHWIKTLETFKSLGFQWKNVIVTNSDDLSGYAVGAVIDSTEAFKNLDSEELPETHSPPMKVGRDPALNIRIALFSLALGEKPELKNIGNGIIEIVSYSDRPQWNTQLNDNQFRGKIETVLSSDGTKLWVVNELPLEDYLKGVAEAINDDPFEYQKALVITGRSYALFHAQNGGKHKGEPFHLKNTSIDQLYKGYGFEKRAPNVEKAVEATKGEIIKFNGVVARALYSSDSGGVAKDACLVWGQEFCQSSYDYLRGGVKDPEGTPHDPAKVSASHGVGMSAVGARKMAENGVTYTKILKHYYTGVEITN